MKPVLALVGRPNVGKSTLFNRLTRTRNALVADYPGLTRDRQFGDAEYDGQSYIVIDTGGLADDQQGIHSEMADQVWQAVEQADRVLFVLDARDGITATDETIAKRLRQTGKPIDVILNKIDGVNPDTISSDVYALGFAAMHEVSAVHGRGIRSMLEDVLGHFPKTSEQQQESDEQGIKVAIVGRPNVGKSTLVNRLLGEDRVLTYDMPGTTRDSIYLPFEVEEQKYTLIDTAGVRRRSRIDESIEKFSVIKSLQAMEDAHVVILVLDAKEGITDQDASLLGHIIKAGRGLIITLNKWDNLSVEQKEKIERELDLKLGFNKFAEIRKISALHGTGVGKLFNAIDKVYRAAMTELATPMLTRLLEDLVQVNPPPLVRGKRIKLRYAHQGGKNPPVIVIHGNQTGSVPDSYRRYLVNAFQKHLKLYGTPLRIEFKTGENPYKDRKNKLTKRQIHKRRRLMKHVKAKK